MQIANLHGAWVAVLLAIFLQTGAISVSAQESPAPQTEVSEPQLRSFAKVYVAVEKIRQVYEPRLKEAKDPEEGKQIQQEAVTQIHDALTREGLTEETYNHIFETARADAGLRKILLGFINEERAKS